MDWYPNSDEQLLLRTSVRFATGLAPAVSGSRWFRDLERRDVQDELPGWPPGPTYQLRSAGDKAARRTGRALLVGIPLVANLIANLGGAAGTPLGDVPGRGKPDEPENEVHDFPVMWAAPGSLARTVPWQLDPGRRPEDCVTDLVLTDRRLLFLATRKGSLEKAETLGEFARDTIAEVRRMKFSEINADVRVTFTDGSWVRLSVGNPDNAERLEQVLGGTVRMLAESELSEGQLDRVARFKADLPKTAHPPTYSRLRSGVTLVESRIPVKAGSGLFETHSILMDDSGQPAEPAPGDL
ncbi:hypothetical protein DEJ49_14390 [Streptomyces venezuelae]|uniref:Uncharacterized protein n=1 Tax=Streptomyces venezuelae TaxID=54571 RepID=A0A5P2CK20_STRVZ|nr:hypothetical protein [Streptomyces venezuelae]QES42018.1 hypothetical protein DEJ49_14390 [Streptomyces venezuelae]